MGEPRRPLLAAYMGALFAFLYLPIAILVVLSFNDSKLATVWRGFSLRWYEELFRDTEVLLSIRTTLVIAIAATLLSILFGTLLAFGIERHTRSPALENGIYLPLLIPDVVTGIGLLSFFATISLPLGTTTVIIAHSVWGTAFAAAIVRTRLRGFDRSVEEASLDLGVREVPTFLRITLPAISPGIIAAALVVFTLSIDEFIIAYFTAGQTVTFPIQVYSMIRFGVTPEINAVATVMLLFSMALIVGAYLIACPRGPRAARPGEGPA